VKARRNRRRIWAIATSAAVGLAGIGAGAGAYVHYQLDANSTCMNDGATIVTHYGRSGECVGITDGAYRFDPALRDVEQKIRNENKHVAHDGLSYVSVAYLMPISAHGGVLPVSTVTEQLEGAYAAQRNANNHSPQIQLLIASDGLNGAAWGTVVPAIERAVTSQHLVAVAGLGVSLPSTMHAILKLTQHIPVIGSSITSDTFDSIPGFVRISPSNHEEGAAALSFINLMKVRTAFLLEDTNRGDSYSVTLRSEFSKFSDAAQTTIPTESYNSYGDSGPTSAAAQTVGQAIESAVGNICQVKPDVVLFAGRGRDLATLLSDLAHRTACPGQRITILTGDDVTDMPHTPGVREGLSSGVRLFYAGSANPGVWSSQSIGNSPAVQAGRHGFMVFRAAFTRYFPHVSFDDGSAMMGYDATLTAESAIQLARDLHPTPSAVAGELSALQYSHVVLGATGPISLPADYTSSTGSNPFDKPIPILQFLANGNVRFVKLDWSQSQSLSSCPATGC
jgi:hypothetical protein